MHRFKKFSRGGMPPNPPSNAHGFAMRSMSLRDMQIPKSEKKILGPPLPNPGDAQGCQLSRIWRDSHAFDLAVTHALTQLTNLLTHLKETHAYSRNLKSQFKNRK